MTEAATVRVQRVMPAVPEVVFDEWLDRESLGEWMCPVPSALSTSPSNRMSEGPCASMSTIRAPAF